MRPEKQRILHGLDAERIHARSRRPKDNSAHGARRRGGEQ